jgi:hypothetical protein
VLADALGDALGDGEDDDAEWPPPPQPLRSMAIRLAITRPKAVFLLGMRAAI